MSASLMIKAEALVDLGRHAEALALCRERLREEPEERRTLYLAGYCAYRLAEDTLARDFAHALIVAHPDDPRGYEIKARLADRRRQPREAETHYREALKRSPENPFYYWLLAIFLDRWHREPEAIKVAEHGLQYDAEDEGCLRILSRLYREAGDLARAEEYGRRALAADPERAESHVEAGLRRLERGEHDAAVEALRRGLSLDPTNKRMQATIVEGQLRTSWLYRLRLRKRTVAALLLAPFVWPLVGAALDGVIPVEATMVVSPFLALGSFFALGYIIVRLTDRGLKRLRPKAKTVLFWLFVSSPVLWGIVAGLKSKGIPVPDWLDAVLFLPTMVAVWVGIGYVMWRSVRNFVLPLYRARLEQRLRSGKL